MSRLSNALLQSELITPQQLAIAEANKKSSGKSLKELIIELGFVKEGDLLKVLAEFFNLEFLSLNDEVIDLIPVKPIKDREEEINNIFDANLTALFEKIRPNL